MFPFSFNAFSHWLKTNAMSICAMTGTYFAISQLVLFSVYKPYLPSAVILMSATSAGVPTNAPTPPADIPIAALTKKLGGFPSFLQKYSNNFFAIAYFKFLTSREKTNTLYNWNIWQIRTLRTSRRGWSRFPYGSWCMSPDAAILLKA